MSRQTLPFDASLLPQAFRDPQACHGALQAQAAQRFGADARLGHNVALGMPQSQIAIPHEAMWTGRHDPLVRRATAEIIGLLETYDPEIFRTNVGIVPRESTAQYLAMTQLRVCQCIDALLARGLAPGASVIEIGSLFGSFSLPLRRLGFDVTAVDRYRSYGASFAGYTKMFADEGVSVISTSREDEATLADRIGQFDVTLAMAVIEHIPHTPRHFLQSLRRMTRPGGLIAIDTPNVTRFWNRQRLNQGESIFQDIRVQYACEAPYEGHHREYTAAELVWMLEQIGCSDISVALFDYNMLQFQVIDPGVHMECLGAMLENPELCDTVLVVGRVAADG